MTDSNTPAAEDYVLDIRNLSWHVGGIQIIRDVTLQLRRGEFLSVIGPNGAGKSSMVNLLSGSAIATSGQILYEGRDIVKKKPPYRVQHGIGRTFQTSSIFPGLSVLENVRLGAQAKLGGSGSIIRHARRSDEASERSLAALEQVNLAAVADRPAGQLSHGDKRKLEIAIVAVQEPKVLLLDEPTSGASAEEVDVIIEIARGIHRAGNSVLMVEHRIELVADLSDRIAVMHNGELMIADAPDVVLSDPRVHSAYLGEGI